MNKSQLFKTAWQIAENQTVFGGGTKKEWFAYGLTQAWSMVERDAKKVEEPKQEVKSLKGGMTSKQNWFIDKLMTEVDGMGIDVLNVYGVRDFLQDGFYATSKQDASDLISELLSVKKAA